MKKLQFAKNFLDAALEYKEFEFTPSYLNLEEGDEERRLMIFYQGYSFYFTIEYNIHHHETGLNDPDCTMYHMDLSVKDIAYNCAQDEDGEDIDLHEESIEYLISKLKTHDLS